MLLSCLAVNSLSDSCEYLSERDVGTIIIPPKTMINTDDPYNSNQWYFDNIGLDNANVINDSAEGLKIGIIDSGINKEHEDLKGLVDETLSYDFTGSNNPFIDNAIDGSGHGTKIAGIIGAKRNNSVGIAGVCDDVSLVSLKITNSDYTSSAYNAALAIKYAEEKGIKLLNLSSNFSSATTPPILGEAIRDYSGIIVCSAGNYNKNSGKDVTVPQRFDYDNLLVVGASDESNEAIKDFYTDEETVDLLVPGINIYTTTADNVNSYDYVSGTSYSTAIVTGAIALLYGSCVKANKSFSWLEFKENLMSNVTKKESLYNTCVSGGILNVYNSLEDFTPQHEHNYVSLSRNSKEHSVYCSLCGESRVGGHVVLHSDTISNRYVDCIMCGYLLDMYFDKAMVIYD